MRQSDTAGWSPVEVPNAWNATDESHASMRGSIGWYRKDFRLPSSSARYDWVLRFESVNYRAAIWMNGKRIGSNRGAYIPFEVRVPRATLRRGGVNRLVVRVENRRKPWDLPPASFTPTAVPAGGWWNYGGLLREVYLRRVDKVDIATVQVLPTLPCRACAATVRFKATVHNDARAPQRVRVSGTFGGQRVSLRSKMVRGRGSAVLDGQIRVKRPRLWTPSRPSLYTVRLTAYAGGKARGGWTLRSGIRSIRVERGKLRLNGGGVNIRGAAIHEDDPTVGFALTNELRRQYIDEVRELGATMIRSHYPLHPYFHELADELGILVWSEIPMYAIKTTYLKSATVRSTGADELRKNILANGSHPSIAVWSVGNELSSKPGPVQGEYLAAAAAQAKRLDPTRPVGYAVAGYPAAGCQSEYAPLDVLGINEYFGWYPGPNGQLADRSILSGYLDQVRSCYRDKAIMITEFGAEANREGPVEEKGTYAHQQDFVNYHHSVYASKPWLSGAIYWALKEFRVRPEWEGGNPRPTPPLHQKGVIRFDGTKKPAFYDLQRLYKATDQYPGQ
jgi:beta-glucuronidase